MDMHCTCFELIGQCINPTGRPDVADALISGDYGYIASLARAQWLAGARYIDINAALPGIDEGGALGEILRAVSDVCPAIPVLDSADPEAMARALKGYRGKVIINSVTAAPAKMHAVFSLARDIDADIIALAMGCGLPSDVAGRIAALESIISAAEEYDIDRRRIIADCLVLTIAAQPEQAIITLDALSAAKSRLGLRTVLGISNLSSGMPGRDVLNGAFLAMAVARGLDMAIVNPLDERMSETITALRLLGGMDDSPMPYIARMRGR